MMRGGFRPGDYEVGKWRLLVAGAGDGAMQLAIDEAILEGMAAGESGPTLRFYQWQRPGVSIGREQAWDVLDLEACAEQGWDVVRRLTEGRAILHLDEVNYGVWLPAADGRVQGNAAESSQRLNEGVRAGLKLLGLDPARTRSYYQDHGEPGAAFFDGPAEGDILVAQNKLVACAQVRQGGAVMQQGSLILGGDITKIREALWVEQPGQRLAVALRMRYRAITLENGLGRRVALGEVAAALQQGFTQALNVALVESGLTEKEMARAGELRATKYGTEEWTRLV